jgi:glutamyl-tRNA reductase
MKELFKRGVQDIAVVGRRIEPLEALKSEFSSVNFLPI